MAHIHTKPYQHDLTASGYIFRLGGDEPRVLLHYHEKLGGYMQFGGHVELDEHPWQTINRELREESGYDFDQLHVLQPCERVKKISAMLVLPQPALVFSVTYGRKTDHFHDDLTWVFVTHEPPRHAPAAGESRDMLLLTRTQLTGPEGASVIHNVREIIVAILDTYLPTWKPVPAKPLTHERVVDRP